NFKGPVFLISGATGEGTRELCRAVMELIEAVGQGMQTQVRGNFELPAAPRAPRTKATSKAIPSAKKPAAKRKPAAGSKSPRKVAPAIRRKATARRPK